MQKLGLETFSLFSGSTVKNPNFSEFYIISLIIENAQVDFKSEISPQQKLGSLRNLKLKFIRHQLTTKKIS